MGRLLGWLGEHLTKNAKAMRDGPVVVIAAIAIAGTAAYWLAACRYSIRKSSRSKRRHDREPQGSNGGLQEQIRDIRDQVAESGPASSVGTCSQILMAIYQFGVLVGSAQKPKIDTSRGVVSFGAIVGVKNLNRYRDIEYGDLVLKITKVSSTLTAKIGGEIQVSFNDVTCEIVGRVSR